MIAFVEGSMERQFINANFKYVHVVPVLNGITWTVPRLCSQIETAYSALNFHGETFVWLDREGRVEPAADIKNDIRATLINAGADPNRLFILVNDKMSENIILADSTLMQGEFGDPNYAYAHEGQNGKRFLAEKFADTGVNYKEMIHGVRMLKRMRMSNAAMNSASAESFLNDFGASGINCWWM